jgi:hypothetical protein
MNEKARCEGDRMKRALLSITLCWLPVVAGADALTDSCTVCHKDTLSLATWQAPALAARLTEMRDGRAQHVVPLPKLSDEELQALAAALAGN